MKPRPVFLVGALMALLAACSSRTPPANVADVPPDDGRTAPALPSPTPTPFGVQPLTGTPAMGASDASRPAIAIAVSRGSGVPTAVGLDTADVVFEEVSGTGQRRMIAVFQSQAAARVGPVAQTRPMDARLLPILRPVFGHGGGPTRFVETISKTPGVTDASAGRQPTAYTAQGGHRYTSTASLARFAAAGAVPPSLFQYAGPGLRLATVGEQPTRQVSITYPGETAEVWTDDHERGRWVRAGTPQITTTNLVVLTMPYREVRGVRTAEVFGSGTCTVAAGGFSAPCTWNRKGVYKLTLLVDGAGFPVRLSPGPTWVVFAPTGSTVKAT